MSPLRPEILVEFVHVNRESDYIPLYECPICKALVTKDSAQQHGDWHSGERMRNFGGF